MMRIVHSVFLLMMLMFMAVQFNDSDGLMWAAIYGLPALMMLAAVLRPSCFCAVSARAIRGLTTAAMAAGVILFWPQTPEFWSQAVWWKTESAREGMGMMVAFLVTLSSFLVRSKK